MGRTSRSMWAMARRSFSRRLQHPGEPFGPDADPGAVGRTPSDPAAEHRKWREPRSRPSDDAGLRLLLAALALTTIGLARRMIDSDHSQR